MSLLLFSLTSEILLCYCGNWFMSDSSPVGKRTWFRDADADQVIHNATPCRNTTTGNDQKRQPSLQNNQWHFINLNTPFHWWLSLFVAPHEFPVSLLHGSYWRLWREAFRKIITSDIVRYLVDMSNILRVTTSSAATFISASH